MKTGIKEKVDEEIAHWEYLHQLPQVWHGFTLGTKRVVREGIYDFFCYVNEACHRSVIAYYHAETNEYKLRECIGVLEFCLIECMAEDLAGFEALLKEKLDGILLRLGQFDPGTIISLVNDTQVTTWDYAPILPAELEGFSLFIAPSQPLRITNGSYIILDYEDFALGSNFIVYYNVLRDDFFGEARVRGVPEICYEFDAANLAELQKNLADHLLTRLREIRRKATE